MSSFSRLLSGRIVRLGNRPSWHRQHFRPVSNITSRAGFSSAPSGSSSSVISASASSFRYKWFAAASGLALGTTIACYTPKSPNFSLPMMHTSGAFADVHARAAHLDPAGTTVETRTQSSFPNTLTFQDGRRASVLSLQGVGARFVMYFFTAYSLAFYFEDSDAAHAAYEKAEKEDSISIGEWASDVRNGSEFVKCIRLDVPKAEMEGAHLQQGLAKSILPFLLDAKVGESEATSQIERLQKAIPNKMKKDDSIDFVLTSEAVCIRVNGETVDTIKSKELSEAIVEVYFGDRAVSTDLLAGIQSLNQ